MIEINKNTDPEHPENKGKEPELIIPKMAFEALKVDVQKLFKKQLVGYEFHFNSFVEAKEFAVDVYNTAPKPIDIKAYLMIYDIIVAYQKVGADTSKHEPIKAYIVGKNITNKLGRAAYLDRQSTF